MKNKELQVAKEQEIKAKDESIFVWKRNMWLFLPVMLVIITFSASLNFGFVSDDRAFLQDNKNLVSQPVKEYFQKGVWEFSSIGSSEGQLYRPLALLNYRLQSELWDVNPKGFHFVNLVAHAIVTILVFLMLALLIPSASGKSIALATSIFAVHPVQVESVCWILGNNDIWVALWSFIAIILMFSIKGKNNSYLALVSMAAIFAAMLTKEIAYTLPGLVAILLFIRKDKFSLKNILILTALSSSMLIAVLFLRKNAVEPATLAFSFDGVGKAVTYFLGYIKMILLPFPQRFYLTEPSTGMVALWEIIIGFIAILGYSVLLWKKKESRRFLTLALMWYLLILAPAIAISFHEFRPTFASRLLYLAIFPLSMIVLWLLNNSTEKWKSLIERLVIVVISVFMVVSIWTTFSWKDQGRFLQLAMVSTPDNVALHIDMGDYYVEKGKLNEAIESYNSAVTPMAIDKTKITAHERLGEIYGKNNFLDKARLEFEAILMLDSINSSGLNGLGNIAWLSGDLISAKKHYENVLRFHPQNSITQQNLTLVNRLLFESLQQKTDSVNRQQKLD